MEEADAAWYQATMALADNGWDCPTEDDWAECTDTSAETDKVHASEDKCNARFRWLGTRTATTETHDGAADQPAEYRICVGVPSRLAALLIQQVRHESAESRPRQLTANLPLLRSYVDDFFKGGWAEHARVQGNGDNGVELRFSSRRATANPVQLHIVMTADAASPLRQELPHFFTNASGAVLAVGSPTGQLS